MNRFTSVTVSAILLLFLQIGSFALNNNAPIVLSKDKTILLPVFPLRKSVRLPTDQMILNLYEERYLAMSEYILKQTPLLFGALYVSDKPQLVQEGGTGKIVPLLKGNEIGLLCLVREWEEGMVPCKDPTLGERRRIRLNAIGVSRFQIEEVIHDGTAAAAVSSNTEENPFILVKASLVTDQNDDTTESVRKRQEQHQSIRQRINEKLQRLTNNNEVPERSSLELSDLVSSQVTILGCDNYDEEVFSFAASSILCPNGPSPKSVTSLLEMTSTQERLDKIDEWK